MFGAIFKKFRRSRGAKPENAGFDIDQFGDMCNRSLVIKISVIVIVWAFCAMIMTLSRNSQTDISKWEVSPRNFIAKEDFKYTDVEKTEMEKRKAEENTPECFSIDKERSDQIKKDIQEFFSRIIRKSKGEKLPADVSDIATLVDSASPELITKVAEHWSDGETLSQWNSTLESKHYSGILSSAEGARHQIKIIHDDGVRISKGIDKCDVNDFVNSAADIWGFDTGNEKLRKEFIDKISSIVGDGTLIRNDQETIKVKKEASEKVESVTETCRAGEKIVDKGDRITPTLRNKLEAYREKHPEEFKVTLENGIYNLFRSLVLLAVVIFYLVSLVPGIMKDTKAIVAVGSLIIIGLIVNYWAIEILEDLQIDGKLGMREFIAIGIPVELPMVLITVLLGYRQALAAGFFIISISVLMFMPDQYNQLQQAMRWLMVGGICSLCVINVSSYRTFFLRVFFVSLFTKLLIYVDWAMLFQIKDYLKSGVENSDGGAVSIQQLITQGSHVLLGSCFASAVLALVLVFIYEIIFNVDTNMALTVLGNFSHNILDEMRRKAPGTMAHSLSVSTLAEDAAKAIGANSLRAKVAALFHDIGKIENPEYFTENNPDSAALYEGKSPELGSMIIRGHVKNGIELSHQHHLFRYIREAVATHHGDDLVKFFYEKAKEECRKQGKDENSVNEADFRYKGKPPRSKELVILSLADACEAASRSLKDPSAASIEKLVDDIIVGRLLGGQLRNGVLTLEELCIVRNSFVKTLKGIYHGRIAYPDGKKNEKTDLRVEKPASAGAKSPKA